MCSFSFRTETTLAISLALCLGLAEPATADDTPAQSDKKAKPNPVSRIPATPYHVLAFSPNGKLLATAEDEVRLYDLAAGRELARVHWDSDSRCRHLAFSPDGRQLVSAHEGSLIGQPDLYVYLWEVGPDNKLRRVAQLLARHREERDYFTGVYHASFSPDSRTVVAGSPGEMIYLWDCRTTKERLRLRGGVAAAFAADGRTLLVVSHDGLIRRFDAASGQALVTAKDVGRSDFIFTEGVAFAANGERVAVWDHNQVLLQETRSSKRISRLTFPAGCNSVILSADGRILIVAERGGGIWFFDATTGKELGWRNGGNREFGDAGLALTADVKTFAWVENKKLVEVQALQDVLAGCVKGPADVRSDPPDVPLQAELIARQDRFVVNRGKLTPEEFSSKLTRSIEPEPEIKPSKEELAKREIERKLLMPVSFNFKDTPLRQVVDDLRDWTGINIVVDKRALKEEKISMDQPVEIKIDGVTLRSALTNILHPMRLTCVIEDEVVKITTLAHAKGRSVLKTDRAVRRIIACPEFAFPSEPRVDLEFRVRNTGKQAFTFFPDLDPTTILAGPGALNISWPCQTGVGPGLGELPVKPITLKPGEKYSVRVTDLRFGSGSQCLWILPGEYSIYASCYMSVSPPPKGSEPNGFGSGSIRLRSPPLKVKVVDAQK
jgi:WD40 repeat protein